MSDMGLYGALYQQLRDYAERFDRALVDLKDPRRDSVDQARRNLSGLLRQITNKKTEDLAARLVGTVLMQEFGRATSGRLSYEALAGALDTRYPTATELSELEQIAVAIDRECSTTLARLRGKT